MNKLKELILGDYFLYTFPSIFKFFFTFLIIVPITTFFLDPEDFGFYALLIGLTMPIQALGASGSKWLIGGNYFWTSKEKSRNEIIFNTLFFEFFIRSFVIAIYYIFAETILFYSIGSYSDSQINLFYILLLSIWLSSLWPTTSFVFIIEKKVKIYAFISILQILLNGLVSTICLMVFNLGVETLFFALLVTNFLSLILEIFFIRNYIYLKLSRNWIKKVFNAFIKSIPGSFAETFMFLMERLLIQKFIGVYALGIYNHAQLYQSALKSLTSSLTNSVTAETLQAFSKNREKTNTSNELRDKFNVWLSFLFTTGLGFVFFGDEIISFLTHGKFTEAAMYLPFWILLIFSITYGITFAQFLMSQKKMNFLMLSQLIPSILAILIMTTFTKNFGIMVIPLAVLIANLLTVLSRRIYCSKLGFYVIDEKNYIILVSLILIALIVDNFFNPSLSFEVLMFLIFFIPILLINDFLRKICSYLNYNISQK